MAKVVFTSHLQALTVESLYTADEVSLLLGWEEQALYLDKINKRSVVFQGTDLEYASDDVTAGTVRSVSFKDQDGHDMLTVSGLNLDADDLDAVFDGGGDVHALVVELFKGNDTIIGSRIGQYMFGFAGKDKLDGRGGGDHLFGSAGNDTVTGGGGVDFFVFGVGDDKDRVTDFDADGGEGKQDFIIIQDGAEFDIVKHGKDTIIDLGDGDELTLVGVKASHVKAGDDFTAF